MIVKIGVYVLDIDEKRTKAYYEAQNGEDCDCAGCRNFRKAICHLHPSIKSFFAMFDLSPEPPTNLSPIHAPDRKELFYNAVYSICGTILEGKEPYIQVGENKFQENPEYDIVFDDHESYATFTEEKGTLDPDFPRPLFDLNLCFTLPWLLDEECPY